MPPAIVMEHLWNATVSLQALVDHPQGEMSTAASRTLAGAVERLLEFLRAY